jgi:hypothetical protein
MKKINVDNKLVAKAGKFIDAMKVKFEAISGKYLGTAGVFKAFLTQNCQLYVDASSKYKNPMKISLEQQLSMFY